MNEKGEVHYKGCSRHKEAELCCQACRRYLKIREPRDMDYCKYFADIEKDPKAKTPSLSVLEFMLVKEHGNTCKECIVRVDRVLAKAPKSKLGDNIKHKN